MTAGIDHNDRPYRCGYCGRMIYRPEQHSPECKGRGDG